MTRTGSSRRTFLAGAGAAATAGALGTTGASATPARAQTAAAAAAAAPGAAVRRVAVLGGGVAGLTAAHELAERGYAVTSLIYTS
ncbi:NAD(P)-binding protein, partial [Streptomyces vinaceus]|uniref:NAD(P)-binding protein n=1 Tax=Streptomyces vinaceus TaxID=1960 RepID=UPI0036913485